MDAHLARENSGGNKQHGTGNWKKRGCMMAESLAELCSLVIWKVELGSNELKIFNWGDFQAECWSCGRVSSCFLE